MKLITPMLVGLSVFASAAELEWTAAAARIAITPNELMWMESSEAGELLAARAV